MRFEGAKVRFSGLQAEWGRTPPADAIGVVRLGRTCEGVLSPGMCHREVLFQHPASLIEYVNRHRDLWQAAIVVREPAAATIPKVARQRLNAFLQ